MEFELNASASEKKRKPEVTILEAWADGHPARKCRRWEPGARDIWRKYLLQTSAHGPFIIVRQTGNYGFSS